MKAILLVLGVCSAGPAIAQQDEWITLGRTDTATWEMKPHSLSFTELRGVPGVMIVGQVTMRKTERVKLGKWYVSISDCERGMGQLVVLSIDGEYQYKNDFAFDARTATSGVAEYICALR